MSCKKNCSKIFCSDLDGTLVKGDITEGSIYYKGIVEHLYSLGLVNSIKYPTYADYSLVYFRRLELEDLGALGMPYEIYDSNTQDNAIAQHWKNTISKFFVNYTKNYLKKKAKKGNKIWIVSGSPLIYIAPIVNYLPIDKIVAVEPSKILSYGPGKVKRVKALTNKELNGVAGYIGDTWNNDGPIMSTLRNYNKCAVIQYIYHNQTLNDVILNLKRYNIKKVNAY